MSNKKKMTTITTTQALYTDKAVEYMIRTGFFVSKKEPKKVSVWSILRELWLDKIGTNKNKASTNHDKILYGKK